MNPDKLQLIIRDALSEEPVKWNYQPSTSLENEKYCCSCGDLLELGSSGVVRLREIGNLPIHKECQRAKEGMSITASLLSHSFGFSFLVRSALNGEKKYFFEQFVKSEGRTAGQKLLGHGVKWWKRSEGFTDIDQFTRWARYSYIYEREAPKFTFRGSAVPIWDESMKWIDYKRLVFKPAYKKLDRTREDKIPPCERVINRTAGCCGICSGPINLSIEKKDGYSCSVDHIVPHSKGGSDELSNFQATHSYCNGKKSSMSGGHAPLGWMLGRYLLICLAEDGATKKWENLYKDAIKRVKSLQLPPPLFAAPLLCKTHYSHGTKFLLSDTCD